jgi:hypothetical protein
MSDVASAFYTAPMHTIYSLTLREVAVVLAGKEGVAVTPDDAFDIAVS